MTHKITLDEATLERVSNLATARQDAFWSLLEQADGLLNQQPVVAARAPAEAEVAAMLMWRYLVGVYRAERAIDITATKRLLELTLARTAATALVYRETGCTPTQLGRVAGCHRSMIYHRVQLHADLHPRDARYRAEADFCERRLETYLGGLGTVRQTFGDCIPIAP